MNLSGTEMLQLELFWHLNCVLMVNWTVWNITAAMVRRTLGQYVVVYSRLQLTSHAQPASTLSQPFRNPFENKVWDVYFYKEMFLFVHWNSSLLLTMFPHISWIFAPRNIQHLRFGACVRFASSWRGFEPE